MRWRVARSIDLALHVFPIFAAQLVLLQLAGSGAGQFVTELDRGRALVVSQSIATMIDELSFGDFGTRCQHDEPLGCLAPLLVRYTDHGYFDHVQPIYDSYGGSRSSWEPKTYETVEPAIAVRLGESDLYSSVEVHRVPWDQTYTASQYRDLLWTHSGTQMMREPDRTAMVDELVAVVDNEFDGSITRPLCATLTLAVSRS